MDRSLSTTLLPEASFHDLPSYEDGRVTAMKISLAREYVAYGDDKGRLVVSVPWFFCPDYKPNMLDLPINNENGASWVPRQDEP